MEIKTARDLRVALAVYDIPVGQFARESGIHPVSLSQVLHGTKRMGPLTRFRVEKTLERAEAGELVAERPKRHTVSEQRADEVEDGGEDQGQEQEKEQPEPNIRLLR